MGDHPPMATVWQQRLANTLVRLIAHDPGPHRCTRLQPGGGPHHSASDRRPPAGPCLASGLAMGALDCLEAPKRVRQVTQTTQS